MHSFDWALFGKGQIPHVSQFPLFQAIGRLFIGAH
jgi:hypothetical protein